MNVWIAKAVVLLAAIVMVVIRAPHGNRNRTIPVVKNRKGRAEVVLLTIAWIAFFIPLVWIATPLLRFAAYPLHPVPFFAGVVCLLLGLWLFYRSHADLGTNWSLTLEVRETHRLVTDGVYRRIRHPMYLALLINSLGLLLVIPNWIAGPINLVAMLLVTFLRLAPEEEMMREHFGREYDEYAASTTRLIPGVW